MTIVSRDQERVVRRLVEFAGDPSIVQDALDELREELPTPPTLEQLLRKILQIREARGLGLPDLAELAAAQ